MSIKQVHTEIKLTFKVDLQFWGHLQFGGRHLYRLSPSYFNKDLGHLGSHTVDRGDFVLPGDFVYFGKFDCFFPHFAYNRYFHSFYALSNKKYTCFVKFW